MNWKNSIVIGALALAGLTVGLQDRKIKTLQTGIQVQALEIELLKQRRPVDAAVTSHQQVAIARLARQLMAYSDNERSKEQAARIRAEQNIERQEAH